MTSGVKGSNLVAALTLMPSPCVGRAGEVWGACAGWAPHGRTSTEVDQPDSLSLEALTSEAQSPASHRPPKRKLRAEEIIQYATSGREIGSSPSSESRHEV